MIKATFLKRGLSHLVVLAAVFLLILNAVPDDEKKVKEHSSGQISAGSSEQKLLGPQSPDGNHGFPETVEQIMAREKLFPSDSVVMQSPERDIELPDRTNLRPNPEAKDEPFYPPQKNRKPNQSNTADQTDNPQTIGTSFTAATLSTTGYYPADNMGAVGPSQYICIVNGRIISFNKSTGFADGVINTTTNNFFTSVRNSSSTSDPRIRYDRVSQRWFIVIINVSTPNRILFAVSNTSTITLSTVWTFFYISIDTQSPPISSSCLADYPTLGIDNNALYVGTNNFCPSFNSTDGYVINKANLLAGTLTVTVFRALGTSSTTGPYTPQGVDNFDASATEGYFIGVDILTWSTLIIRRVSNPGTSPSVSGNILLTVSTTSGPFTVNHLGNTGSSGYAGRLDALDDRLFASVMRNGRLWTAHNIGVSNTGSTTSATRNGIRWYELQNLNSTPSVYQSGTVFDPTSPNNTSQLNYWIPTVMVSGQNHSAIIFSSAGTNARINQATVGRLSGDALSNMQSVTTITSSSTAYNPGDLGITRPRRWGDYSYVSLDPNDDMTMWGVMGFCDATNSYGVRVTKLNSPPPPSLTSASPNSVLPGQPSVNVVITGTPTSGQGFYDPGAGFANRINASINGGVTVNSITYNSSTQVTLNISTVGVTFGVKTVTITNPDGQFVSSSSILDTPEPVLFSSFTYSVNKRDVRLSWTTTEEINNRGFDIERQKINSKGEGESWNKIGFTEGHGTTNQQQTYSFTDRKLETGKYNYRLKQIDYNGNFERFNLNSEVAVGVPVLADIFQNYPNPFNPKTKIDFQIPNDGNVSIKIYDLTGKEVAVLTDEFKAAGYYTTEFDATNLASGVYFYRMNSGKFSLVRKMLVVK